jgi:hypothetical protein
MAGRFKVNDELTVDRRQQSGPNSDSVMPTGWRALATIPVHSRR